MASSTFGLRTHWIFLLVIGRAASGSDRRCRVKRYAHKRTSDRRSEGQLEPTFELAVPAYLSRYGVSLPQGRLALRECR